MIGIIFNRGSETVEVRVDDNNLYLRSSDYGVRFATLESLKLSYEGVLKEHPDLKDDDKWREKAIARLKEHVGKIKDEDGKAEYIIKELSKVGYKPYAMQKQGHRPKRL